MKRQNDELKTQLEKSKVKNTLQEDFDKLKKEHLNLEAKLHNTEQHLQVSEKSLKTEKDEHQKLKHHCEKLET